MTGGAAAPASSGSESLRVDDGDSAPAGREDAFDAGATASPVPVYGQAAGGSVDGNASPGPGASQPPEAAPDPSPGAGDPKDASGDDRQGSSAGDPASEATNGTPSQWLVVLSLSLVAGGLGLLILTRERRPGD
jgi:hypothetical protein